jgi:formylglycine-generating enzyme
MTNHLQILENKDGERFKFTMIIIEETLNREGYSFKMGSDKALAEEDEKPVHKVKLSSYYLAEMLVTQDLWKWFMNDENPSKFNENGDKRPIEMVSFNLITTSFLPKLNELTIGTRPYGYEYALPTEAQWEYAAREGKHNVTPEGKLNETQDFLYSGSEKINEVGWYFGNSHNETKEVGLKTPNALGIYDMTGNVFEWCRDEGTSDYYKICDDSGIVTDPCYETGGRYRVMRGGRWGGNARYCRVSSRSNATPDNRNNSVGFRLALIPVPFSV